MSAAASLVSPVSSIKDRWNGMSYIQKLLELARQPQMDTTLENVREIAQRIFFNRAPVRCSINCQPVSLSFIYLKLKNGFSSIFLNIHIHFYL